MILLTDEENPYSQAKVVDESRKLYSLPNGIVMEHIAVKMCQQAFCEGTKAQLKKVVDGIALLDPPIIKAKGRIAFYAGYQKAKEDWQALLKEVEGE